MVLAKPVGLPVSVRVGHFKAQPGPEARSLEDALPVQGSWRVGLGSGSGFGSGLTSLNKPDRKFIKSSNIAAEIGSNASLLFLTTGDFFRGKCSIRCCFPI